MLKYAESRLNYEVAAKDNEISEVRRALNRDEPNGEFELRIMQVHVLALDVKGALDIKPRDPMWSEFICKLDKALWLSDGPLSGEEQRSQAVEEYGNRKDKGKAVSKLWVETQLKSRPSIADQPGNHTTHCTQNSDAGVLRPVAALSAPPVTTTTSTAPGEREVTVPSRHSSPGGNTGNASAPQSLPRSLQSNGNGGRGVRRNPANRIPLSLVPDIGEAIVNYQPPSNGGSVRLHNQTAVNDGRASYHRRTQSANTSPTTVQRDQDMESGLRDLLSCMEQINVMSQLPVCSICGRRHLPNDPNLRTVWLILMMGAQLASVTYANAERHGPEAPATIEVDEQRMDPRLAGFYTRLTTVQRISLLGIFALFASVVAIMIPWPLTAG